MNGDDAVSLRCAVPADSLAIAGLFAIAGEGIPTWLWRQSATAGQDPLAIGAARAARPDADFSYRSAVLAERNGRVAGLMLGYRLPRPTAVDIAGLNDLPALLRPLVELEHAASGSFHINALAVHDGCRDRGIGTRLLQAAAGRATSLGCTRLSLQVFSQNIGAVRLYERNGYRVADSRPVVAHPCHPCDGRVLLMLRAL